MGASGQSRAAVFGSLQAYRRGWLRADLLAGLTVWAILVPESLAYAVLAGVPPAVGLWATPAALLLYAALGSSRHLVVGPMSATSALSGVVVAGLAGGEAGARVGADRGTRPGDRPHYRGGRSAASGVPRRVRLTTGAQGLHHRARPDDRGRSGAEVARPRAGRRGVRREGLGRSRPSWATPRGGGRRRRGFAGAAAASAAVRPPAPGGDGRGAGRGAGLGAAGPARAWGGRRRSDRERSAAVRAAGAGPRGLRRARRRRRRHRPRRVRRGPRCGEDYATKAGYDIEPDRELLGVGAANLGAGLCAGMVVAGSLSKTAANGARARARRCPGWSSPC